MSTTASTHPDAAVVAGTTPHGRIRSALGLPEFRWAGIATGLFAVGAIAQVSGAPAWIWWALYLACYATGGWEPAVGGVQALREKVLDVDLLMIVAALIAALIGQVFDGALLIVIFATSGALEAFATRRTEDSVKALLDLAPEQATVVSKAGEESVVGAADLEVGDVILVRPGERIGGDGLVVDGLSEVAQASITGEPMPVTKQVGDEVFAGTLNGVGALRIRVTRAAHETVVARIVALVEEASATKAKTQLFIERIEQRYSVGMVAATVSLFVVPLALGASFEPTLLRAMTFMIVASPCAVVLATMPPLLATIANAGRHGVLVKSAVALEELGRVDLIAFDKTGTLTHGTPRVAILETVGEVSSDEVLRSAAAAEQPSEHPVARAVVAAARERGLVLGDARDFDSTPGRGVTARVEGHVVTVGSPALLTVTDQSSPATIGARRLVAALEATGHTVVVVLLDQTAAGVIALTDQVRAGSREAVASLAALTTSPPVMLTGDNQHAAARLASEVGIARVQAGLLPEQKVEAIHELQRDGNQVVLVGDGVNDAPAMAAAKAGVAMGHQGSDLALETADAILVRDDLQALATTISLARRAHRVVRANLMIAGTVIGTLVLWDILGTLPLPLGVAGHEGSTILVALNGLRLLRKRAWR